MLYAKSEWEQKELDLLMTDKSQPIGSVIAKKGFESYREINKIYTMKDSNISEMLGKTLLEHSYNLFLFCFSLIR